MVNDGERFLSDGEFFVRGDDPNFDFRIIRRNFSFLAVTIVLYSIDFDAQKPQSFTNFGANVRRIFADTRGKNDGVDASHNHRIRADVFDDAIIENVHSANGRSVPLFDAIFEDAAIVRQFRQAEEPGFFINEIVELIDIHALSAAQISQDRGVDVAATRSHDKPFERCQPHGSIDGFTALNGSNRGAATDMASDDIEIFDIFTEDLCHAIGDVHMRSTVSAIAADMIFSIIFIRYGIEVGVFWDRLMEGRIEYGDAGGVGEEFFRNFQPNDVGGHVKRIERIDGVNRLDDGIVDEARMR